MNTKVRSTLRKISQFLATTEPTEAEGKARCLKGWTTVCMGYLQRDLTKEWLLLPVWEEKKMSPWDMSHHIHKPALNSVWGLDSLYLHILKTSNWEFHLNWSWVDSDSECLEEANVSPLWRKTPPSARPQGIPPGKDLININSRFSEKKIMKHTRK